MEKLKQYKYIIIPVITILSFIFYWTEVRSVLIKKECSQYTEVIPADAGITKEQADINKKIYNQCKVDNPNGGRLYPTSFKCFNLEKDIIERPPQPEKEVIKEATKIEYDKCLRQNGL